jgi:hypothetical protein
MAQKLVLQECGIASVSSKKAYGDLAQPVEGPDDAADCGCQLPWTIHAGGSYACAYLSAVEGSAGDVQVYTLTATGEDDLARQATAQEPAPVRTIVGRHPSIPDTCLLSPGRRPEPVGRSRPSREGESRCLAGTRILAFPSRIRALVEQRSGG